MLAHPAPHFEEEFNAWYDTEHLPERMAVPGFEAARRYVCVSGRPSYLAVYDMESRDVLESEAYLAVSFDRSSPWTKRVTSRSRVHRSAGVQIYPGHALTPAAAHTLMLRFGGLERDAAEVIVAGMRANFETLAQTVQVRVFAHDADTGTDFIGLVDALGPVGDTIDHRLFGDYAKALDLANLYAPY
ncbi:hypothetical protein BPUN_2302 [Candidatus Paraburkholderia kirkii]|nr:hypothetical protein BPUN_2302 [Candidatus Paraburkholderia kirkii]